MLKILMGMQTTGSQGEDDRKQNQPHKIPKLNSFNEQIYEEIQKRWGNEGLSVETSMHELLKKAVSYGVVHDAGAEAAALEGMNAVIRDYQQNEFNSENLPMGHMTLEQFLGKAGVFSRQLPSFTPQPMSPHPHPRTNITTGYIPLRIGADVAFPVSPPRRPSTQIVAMPVTLTQAVERASFGEVVEMSVERRQKRMIKNRESAARSRARKQAYTSELESKVAKLEEENEKLRKWREVDNILPSTLETRYQLRRTSSAPF